MALLLILKKPAKFQERTMSYDIPGRLPTSWAPGEVPGLVATCCLTQPFLVLFCFLWLLNPKECREGPESKCLEFLPEALSKPNVFFLCSRGSFYDDENHQLVFRLED